MHRVEGRRNEQHQIEVIRCKKLLNANDTTHPNGENVLHVGCVIVYLYRENSFAGKPENFTFFSAKTYAQGLSKWRWTKLAAVLMHRAATTA